MNDRAQVRNALRLSEEKFSKAFRASPSAVSLTRMSDGFLLDVNESWERLLGYSRGEILGRTTLELGIWVQPDDRKEIVQALGDGQSIRSKEIQFQRKDGEVIVVRFSCEAIEIAGEHCALAVFEDITVYKRTEEALRKSEAAIRSIFEVTPVGIALLEDRVIRKINASFSRITGYSEEELLGKTTSILYASEEDFVRAGGALYGQMEKHGIGEIEIRSKRKDGTVIDVMICVSSLDPSDPRAGVSAAVLDITERKRAEEGLKKSEGMLRSMLQAVPVGVGLLVNRVMIQTNPSLARIVGYSEEELLGQDTRMLYPDDREYERVRQEAYAQMEKEGLGMCEATLKRKDGRLVNVMLCLSPFDANDLSAGTTATVLDITERKRAEEERRRLEAQLAQAQKMESVGRLAGGVAHDFNNMLLVILGYGELMMMDLPEESPLRRQVQDIIAAGQRAQDLTRQLLAFSRKQVLEVKPIDIGEVVLGIKNIVERLLGEDIEMRINAERGLGLVNADRSQLEQVILNLCINSRDAMPDGGLLTIDTSKVFVDEDAGKRMSGAETCPSGWYVTLSVRDTGCGMDEETQQRIFDPFFTTKGKGKGTGLGLSTVFGIVKQHGGDVRVESEPGRGAVFSILLPEAQVVETEETRERQEGALAACGETILVIEDEESARELICQMLSSLGYEAVGCGSGEECFEMLGTSRRVDLLLSDVILPGRNGRQICDHALEMRPGLKVVFMSGYTENIIAHHGMLEQGVHFIAKPFSRNTLSRKIRDVLNC